MFSARPSSDRPPARPQGTRVSAILWLWAGNGVDHVSCALRQTRQPGSGHPMTNPSIRNEEKDWREWSVSCPTARPQQECPAPAGPFGTVEPITSPGRIRQPGPSNAASAEQRRSARGSNVWQSVPGRPKKTAGSAYNVRLTSWATRLSTFEAPSGIPPTASRRAGPLLCGTVASTGSRWMSGDGHPRLHLVRPAVVEDDEDVARLVADSCLNAP